MDDLGNILYLVLIIGFSLIGFFKSKKKNIESEVVVNEIDEENVKELLRKLAKEEQKESKVAPPPQIKKQEFKRESLRKDEKRNNTQEKLDEEKTSYQEFNIESLDDARRAFVYSEIFQRKY